jgi:hypothetical protein
MALVNPDTMVQGPDGTWNTALNWSNLFGLPYSGGQIQVNDATPIRLPNGQTMVAGLVGYTAPTTPSMDTGKPVPPQPQLAIPTPPSQNRPPATPTAPTGPTPEELAREDAARFRRGRAADVLHGLFSQWFDPEDIQSLNAWAWGLIQQDVSEAGILLQLRQRPEYEKRFPGMRVLKETGQAAIDEATYIAYERTFNQLMRTYNMPSSFWDDRQDVAEAMRLGVNPVRLERRLRDGYSRVAMAAPEVRQVFAEWFGPDGDTALAMFFIDPNRAEVVLEEAVQTGVIGGIARRHTVNIAKARAERLTQLGVTDAAAEQGFARISALSPLFRESVTEREDLTKEEHGVNEAFDLDPQARHDLQRRLGERKATTEGGGGAVFTRTGTGLGRSRS